MGKAASAVLANTVEGWPIGGRMGRLFFSRDATRAFARPADGAPSTGGEKGERDGGNWRASLWSRVGILHARGYGLGRPFEWAIPAAGSGAVWIRAGGWREHLTDFLFWLYFVWWPSGSNRVSCDGSLNYTAQQTRCAYRFRGTLVLRSNHLRFRLVLAPLV